jgi:DNA-binding LacI/PurR family transcriptional regulator
MGNITIREIAKMAGVCIGTVSRVINNKDKVHPRTREKILQLIEENGYHPSALGQGLRSRFSRCLLLQVPNIADPYSASVAKNMSAYCRSADYKMFLGDSNYDPATEAYYLNRLRDGGVDGLIISPLPGGKNNQLIGDLAADGFPLVAMDNALPDLQVNSVRYDDYAGSAKAMDYLFEKGHRRIAFLQQQIEFQTVRDRARAYRDSFEKRGLAFHPEDIITAPNSLKNWDYRYLDQLLQQADHPTAILTENEMMASLCISALERLHKRIPQDVAIIAFGDVLMEQFTSVALTAVSLHHEAASREALDLLLELIGDPQLRALPPREFLHQPELIVRDSA